MTQLPIALISVALLAACSATDAPAGPTTPTTPTTPAVAGHPPRLAGTVWAVVSVAGRAPLSGWEPDVTFSQTDVSGSDGCNRFDGTYRYDGATGRLAIGPNLSRTKMACLRSDDLLQSAFIGALGAAAEASVDADGRLILSGPAGQLRLVAGR